MQVRCCTYFDITATGVKNHYKQSHGSFNDATGKTISDSVSWHRARNQQRNWETVNQLISLRALPIEISMPVICVEQDRKIWSFEFTIEQEGALALGEDILGALLNDSYMVPMVTGLDETPDAGTFLSAGRNIFFSVVSINTS